MVWQGCRGKEQVAERVFVGAVDLRGWGQRGESLQRMVELLCGSAEQTATAPGKEGVAAEEHRRSAGRCTEIGDMVGGVPRAEEYR